MRWAAALAAAFIVLAPSTAMAADKPDPPNKTGCCFSFDDSPVTLVFCMTENACKIGGGK